MALVLAGHLALLAVLIAPTKEHQPSTTVLHHAHDTAILVRFVAPVPTPRHSVLNAVLLSNTIDKMQGRVPQTPVSVPVSKSIIRGHQTNHSSMPPESPVHMDNAHKSSMKASQIVKQPLFLTLKPSNYEKQGNIGIDWSQSKPPPPRIPGGDHVYGAPQFHMIDPRMQGFAGMVRKAQKLFGIPDSHCMDVDALRRLSPAELARKKYMSESDIEHISERYGCKPH